MPDWWRMQLAELERSAAELEQRAAVFRRARYFASADVMQRKAEFIRQVIAERESAAARRGELVRGGSRVGL